MMKQKTCCEIEPLLERLKEQLFLTTLVKDAAHLELSEQMHIHSELSQQSQQFSEKLSSATTSLDEVYVRNENLAEEVSQYKNQLEEANSIKERLREELNGSKAELEKSSARVNQLLNEFEMSRGDISRLSSELAECRNSLVSSQTENGTLRHSLNLATEEKEQLEVQKNNVKLENENLASELAKCKDLLVSLQSENSNMSEHVAHAEGMNRKISSENEFLLSQNDKLVTELGECKNMLLSLQLENEHLNASVLEERKKIDDEKDYLLNDSEEIVVESIKCMVLVEAMQMEILSILVPVTDERSRLEGEKLHLFAENEKLSYELVNCKALIENLQAEFVKATDDMKDATLHIEQLVEENCHLKSNLEIQKDKMRDLEDWQMRSLRIEKLRDEAEDSRLLPEDHDGSLVLEGLEKHIKEATLVMWKLQKALEGMHFHSASLSKSSGEAGSPGVSKLIHAFETKGNTEDYASGGQATEDPYEVSKEQMQHLEEVLQKLLFDAENAAKVVKNERKHSSFSNVGVAEFHASYESLKEHSDSVEEENLELMILLEALRQHVREANVKGTELVGLYEASQEKAVNLRAEISTITSKISDYEAKHGELQSQLDETYQRSGDVFSSLSSQVEALDEVVSREVVLEEEWNSVVTQIIQTLDRLNSLSTMVDFNYSSSSSDIRSYVASSVDSAINVIEHLKGQLEAAKKDHELVLSTYNEVNEEFKGLQEQHKMAFTMLHKIYADLVRLVKRSCGSIEENESDALEEILLDPRAPRGFDTLINLVEAILSERLILEHEHSRLTSELSDRTNNSVGSDVILKLLEKVDQEFRIERFGDETTELFPQLESLIYSLLQKYKEADERANLSEEMYASKSVESSEFHRQIDHLSLSLIQRENEIVVLEESLKNCKDSVVAIQSELLGKITEVEQSEQRVSSLREKLSIAVTKGKGLIVQRDNLKQSLAETSADFEKCKQDLLIKESRFNELENKLKAYMEAGERMEALESELSYIRNSATALRESFLLKDSALQRIEEILEDLELPENFHSGDIIEKVDWLAKYVSGNSLPLADWDRKTSGAGGAYSDSGMVDAEGWKEEMQPNPNMTDNYQKIYEDLQTRFYALAEQNEMLEQSLMERNNVVQRWEEILNRIEVPSQFRSMEPEDRIEWLMSTLYDTQNYCNSLQEKIDNLETSSALVTTALGRSEQRISELEKALQLLITEKEALQQDLVALTQDYDEMSKKASGLKGDNGSLQREVTLLQERLDQKHGCEERVQYFEGEIRRLQDVLRGVLQDSGLEDTAHEYDGFDYFERLFKKLLDKHAEFSRVEPDNPDSKQVTEDPRDTLEQSKVLEDLKEEIIILNKKLDDTITELFSVKEERNGYLEKNHSLVHEVEAFNTKMVSLQDQLSQEEHKSSTLREKLNVAVRKGKSLMQQRDSLKQVVEETNSEINRMKSVISEYENKMKDFSTLQENLETQRSENIFLRDLISQNDQAVQEKDHTLSLILKSLGHIDVSHESDIVDPVEKLEKIGKHFKDMRADMAIMEQESSKLKRAAELLVAELNEVQERNDFLQEELAKASTDLSALSRERDYFHAEAMQVRSNMDQAHKDLSSLSELLGNVLSNDLETLRDLKVSIKSGHELGDAPSLLAQFSGSIPDDLISFKSGDKALTQGIGSLRGQFYNHLELVHEERSVLADVLGLIHCELNSQKESCESMRRDIQRLESVEIEKDSKMLNARKNFSLLVEACTNTVTEIYNFKTELVGRGDSRVNISPKTTEFTEETLLFSSEDGVRAIQQQLLSAVKDLTSMQAETSEINLKDTRSTIHNLQKDLQEKDIQAERNCMQLVQQIKEAEAIAKKYSQELQLSQGHVEDLQMEVREMEEEHNELEKRIKDLQDKETASIEYKGIIQSLTDELAAKGQENEALLQALDEEEIQMEDMRNRIGELEKVLQQKDQDLEKLDISRGKALKKLSVTVNKFDELHLLSENLLSEVENLQSQLQDRDQEISFLRQEVTRCTKDALLASSNNRSVNEVSELLAWLATMFSVVQAVDSNINDSKIDEFKEMLKEHIISTISELEDLRVAVRNGDMFLQLEKAKVEELTSKEQYLQSSLREKDTQLAMLRGDVGRATTSNPEIVELEPMINNRASPAAAPQVRSLRKASNELVAIAIDVDPHNGKLEEDDDKAHGFKSLTTSRIVPRFTRPVTDMVDGLWVSCDRTLMRQPALRLGVMIYWALLHALLAAYVV
ncbi:hypothetical protein Leryth_013519 [Lithospermum erythrorhizon]|nr:hypothetical protein Leryth_013519 [Lithospermum erythrorhizon]